MFKRSQQEWKWKDILEPELGIVESNGWGSDFQGTEPGPNQAHSLFLSQAGLATFVSLNFWIVMD